MSTAILEFLVMLNPFALYLYLQPVMFQLSNKDFVKVLVNASIISFFIFSIFLFTGDLIFKDLFRINFGSFRIFGGIVLFSFAYLFVVQGRTALIQMKGSLGNLASEIALPFMVGAGTISLTVIMGHQLSSLKGVISLGIILIVNFLIIMALKIFREYIPKQKLRVAFDKNMEILLRLNGFFLGAIGVDMIVSSIQDVFMKS